MLITILKTEGQVRSAGSVKDDTGLPISNVVIKLYVDTNNDGIEDGAAIDSTLSDGDSGNYCFSDVVPGVYVVVEEQPANYNSVDDFDRTTGPLDPDGNR